MKKQIICIVFIILNFLQSIPAGIHANAQELSGQPDDRIKVIEPQKQYYEFSWGTWPAIQALSTNYLSLNALMNDGIGYGIKGSSADNLFVRLMNYLIIPGGISGYLMGTLEHELGHLGQAVEFGFKPHLSGFNTESIRRRFYAKESPDEVILYIGGGMNTDTYTSYEASQHLYSGNSVPCYYGTIILYKKISNFQYVFSKARYMDHPLGNIKEFYKDYDPLLYDVYLTMKYGYYDSVVPVWAYAPYLKKSIFVPSNPYAYINRFLRDQYHRMKTAYLVELLDPSFINLFYGWRQYLKNGDLFFKPLMIPIKEFQFMPGMRASLGNFGVENYYDLYCSVKDLFHFSVYYRYGGNKWDKIHGAGIAVSGVRITDQLSLTCQADYWTLAAGNAISKNSDYLLYNNLQPVAGLGYFRDNHANRNCFNVSIILHWQFYDDWFFIGNIGYKTYGALIGKQLEKGPYGYGGIGFNVNYRGAAVN
jgi:hypothetical protein